MPDEGEGARRECEAFVDRLFAVLDGESWGVIDWDGEDREDFIQTIEKAWKPSAKSG